MPIKLSAPLKKEFHLVESDKALDNTDGATMITIRQATQGDFELVNDLTSTFKREYDGEKVSAIQRISFDDIRRKQVYLTICACNLQDVDGNDLFKFNKDERPTTEEAFRRAWYKLPPVVADEIHEFVLQMNPLWDERIPKKPVKTPEQSGESES